MRIGIRTFLLVGIGAAVAIPTTLIAVSLSSGWSTSEREHADQNNLLRARAVADEVGRLVDEQARSVELLASQAQMVLSNRERLQTVVTAHRRRSKYFSIVYVADAAGNSIVTDPKVDADGNLLSGSNYADRDYYIKMTRTESTAISRIQRGRRSGVPNIQIAAPMFDAEGTFVGFAEGSVDMSTVTSAVARFAENSPGMRILVVDEHQRLIADSENKHQALSDVSKAPAFAQPVQTEPVRSSTIDGEAVRLASAQVTARGTHWRVTVLRQQSAIDATIAAVRRNSALTTSIILAVVLLIMGVCARWLTRPIAQLAAATTAVGEGDYKRPPPEPRFGEPAEIHDLLVSVRDMTRRLGAHRVDMEGMIEALQGANASFRTLAIGIEHAGEAIEITDAAGVIEYVNPAWERLTNRSAQAATGRTFASLSFSNAYEKKEVEVRSSPVKSPDGEIERYVVIRRDVTEERKAEEALRLSDRMASVGTLAAGVAHEINNPLTYVTGNIGFVRDLISELPKDALKTDGEDLVEAIDEALMGVDRVTEIVRGLKSLSRGDEETISSVDMNDLLNSCVRMTSNEIRHRAQLVTSFSGVPRVRGNESRLAQVFINLLVNAAQAIEVGDATRHTISLETSTRNGFVVVDVRDSGCGIEPDLLPKIFDPFFTNKPVGVGTGLGLSICHSIVTSLGGELEVESKVGEGTCFRVLLPLDKSRHTEPLEVIADPVTTGTRILVVDDEVNVGRALARLLKDYDATVVNSAEDALSAMSESTFDVVLCDVMMPETSGVELFERAKETCPGIEERFVFMTGGVFTASIRESLDSLNAPCLNKPVPRRKLVETVESFVQAS